MENQYTALAPYYDKLMEDIPYEKMAWRLDTLLKRCAIPVRDVVELGCGTGTVSYHLSKAGYEMIGVDTSPDMLTLAREKCSGLKVPPVLLQQDMCALDLYGTVQGAVCCLDGVNYLEDRKALKKTMERIGLFMEKKGLFLFDVKPASMFEQMAGTASIYAWQDVYCAWQYGYDKKSRRAVHTVDIFERSGGGYRRTTEEHLQRAYTNEELTAALEHGGFSLKSIYLEYSSKQARDGGGRLLFVAEKAR